MTWSGSPSSKRDIREKSSNIGEFKLGEYHRGGDMTTLNRILFLILVLTLTACAPATNEETVPPAAESTAGSADAQGARWTVTESMEAPESAYVDPASGSIFV